MRKFLFPIAEFVLAFILSSAGLATAQMCGTNAGNYPGDIIQTWTDFWDQGINGFNWDIRINGESWNRYGGVQRLDGGGCLHQCLPLQFRARTANIWIENVVVSGNASGWKCSQIAQIVGHEDGPIPNQKKAVAQEKADRYQNYAFFFGGFAVGPCAVSGGPFLVVTCIGSGSAALISSILAYQQNRIVQKDPWDENYLSIYDPPWPSAEELGLSYTDNWYINQMIGDTQGAVQMVNMMMVEVDRYSSCQMANVDCLAYGVDHEAYINWATWMLGWYLNEIGNNAWNVAWQMAQEGADAEGVSVMREFASTSNEAGWEYQQ